MTDNKQPKVIKVTNPKAIAKTKKMIAEKEQLHKDIRAGKYSNQNSHGSK